ncbi:MAG: hypothetical protein KDD37_07560 [Bdellovibrionales bacterium]|nr:hypothetical protein [Bdellovibrionales bacterium]
MPRTKKIYRIRFVLGLVCLLAGIAFMVHSFLEPKPSPILKPTIFDTETTFGADSYSLLLAKLSEKAILVFYVEDFSKEKDFIVGFLKKGFEEDQREYILKSMVPTWNQELNQSINFSGKPLTEESSDLDTSVAPTYVVLVNKSDMLKDLQLDPDSTGEYQEYHFIGMSVSAAGPSAIKCTSRKEAFLLKSLSDLDCFQLWMEKNIYRQRHRMDLTKKVGAVDQVDLWHYLIYRTK